MISGARYDHFFIGPVEMMEANAICALQGEDTRKTKQGKRNVDTNLSLDL